MYNYLVHPQDLVFNSHRVNGFTQLVKDEHIPQWDLLDIATEVASQWTDDWPEDQGFGSSDMTFVRKSFIDSMIRMANLNGYYETKFDPYLKVVEYSEFEKEEYDLRREQGI